MILAGEPRRLVVPSLVVIALLLGGSVTVLTAIPLTAHAIVFNPLTAPTILPSNPAIDQGQSGPVSLNVYWAGGVSPYVVRLYSSPTTFCNSMSTLVDTNTGVGGTSTSFVVSPTSSIYYCATVTDSSATTTTSGVVLFTINPALTATISPASPTIDSGQSVTLTALASLGTPPYSYQWYNGGSCSSAIVGQTTSSYATPFLTSAHTYSVKVTDSSDASSPGTFCASAGVTVNAALSPTISISPQIIDSGTPTTVKATVAWAGTPPYKVTLYSGSSGVCSSDTTVVAVSAGSNPQSGVTGTSTIFTFNAPGASTYYCAEVTDGAQTPNTASTPTALFTVNPSLGTVTLTLSPTAIDSGYPTSVTATVTWFGGTAPYTVTLYSGSSSTCASDTVVVGTHSGLSGSPTSFVFSSPVSSTYFCAALTESSIPSVTTTTSAILFSVNPPLTLGLTLSSLSTDAGNSATITAAASWSGGTAPFMVTLYTGSSATCSSDTTLVAVSPGFNPLTGQTSSPGTFTFASPSSPPSTTYYYCAVIRDSAAVPVTVMSATSPFTVNPAFSAVLGLVSPSAIDSGQTATVTATVTWSGGTFPYAVAMFSGLSPTCSLDTTAAGSPQTGLSGTSTTITIPSPGSTVYLCARVSDGTAAPAFSTATTQFAVNSPPSVSISPPAPLVVSGFSTTLTAVPAHGTPGYTYQWYLGAGCTAPIAGQTASTYLTGVLSVTSLYSVKVTDSSTGSPAAVSSACASVTVTVGDGPEGVAANPLTGMVYVADPASDNVTVISSVSNTQVTTIPVGSNPWGVAVDQANNTIFVSNYGGGTVSVINGTTNAVIHTIIVGSNPKGIAVNTDLALAYVANSGSNTVSVISTKTFAVVATVPVGSGPQGVAVGPSPTYTVFVTDYGSNTVSVVDLLYHVSTVTVGSNPWGVAVSAADDVYVTNSGSGSVSVLDGSTFVTVATINVGGMPQGIAIGGTTAYVANAATNTLSEINTGTNLVITSTTPAIPIPVGTTPWGVALIAGGPNLAWVTNSGTNTVSVINLSTNLLVATIIVA